MYFRGIAADSKFQEKNEGYLFSEGYLFTGFYGIFWLEKMGFANPICTKVDDRSRRTQVKIVRPIYTFYHKISGSNLGSPCSLFFAVFKKV